MTNIDSILKSKGLTLLTKVCLDSSHVWLWELEKAECRRTDASELWCWGRFLRVPCTATISDQSFLREVNPEYSLEGWCWRWNSNTLATWCKELTHWKRPQCWKWLKAGGEGDDRGWDGWMGGITDLMDMSLNRVWKLVMDRSVLQSMGSQRVGQDWFTELFQVLIATSNKYNWFLYVDLLPCDILTIDDSFF